MGNKTTMIKRMIVQSVIVMILVCSLNVSLYAKEDGYSISLVSKVVFNREILYLSGDTYSLVQIAIGQIVDTDVKFTTLSKFKAFECDWENLSDTQSQEKAKELEKVIKKQDYIARGVTNEDGVIVFNDLKPGVYLLIRIQAAKENQKYICDPVIYNIPMFEDEHSVQQIVVSPKIVYPIPDKPEQPEYPKEPEDSQPSEESQIQRLPQTGQLNWPVPVLMLTGIVFFLLGFEIQYGRQKMNEE